MISEAKFLVFVMLLSVCVIALAGCRQRDDTFVIALETAPETLDPLRGSDASGERLRQLMFNTLVRKNEQFDYVGELADQIVFADDLLSVTFILREGVRFHDGKPLTARDAKYTLDTLIGARSRDYKKSPPFFETVNGTRLSFIANVEAPDDRTLIVRLRRPWNELLANLVPVAIIPEGSAERQTRAPIGSGGFRFVAYDERQQVTDLVAHEDYWQGVPEIKKLRVRVILDANTLQAELRSKRVDMVVSAANLTPDSYAALALAPGLEVKQFPGANIVYLGFNTENEVVRDARLRRAIAHAIDREEIVRALLLGQARPARSILPEESWAFAPGETPDFNPVRAKQILDEAGYSDPDGDGPRMRLPAPLVFKMASANATRQYGSVIQNQLLAVGIPVAIETLEQTSLIAAQRAGQFQITTSRWVGGNQDPIFLRDLFTNAGTANRTRYKNPRVDELLMRAVTTIERPAARGIYTEAQQIISQEVPMLPLWYPATIVVVRRGVQNVNIDPSGDWRFVSKLKLDT